MGGCGGCCDESAFKRIDGRLDDLWNRISLITSEITKVPTKVSDLINDLGFISCADLATCQEIIDIKASIVTDISELTDENDLLFSGDYNDLTNVPPPDIPTILADIPVILNPGFTLGKYKDGDNIPSTGWTFEQLMNDIAQDYIPPTLTNFKLGGQAITTLEVGHSLISSVMDFSWDLNQNSGQIDTVDIQDITAGSDIATGISSVSPQNATINPIQLSELGDTQVWRLKGNNSLGADIYSANDIVVQVRFMRFYGPTSATLTDTTNGVIGRFFGGGLSINQFHTGNTFTLSTGITESKMVVLLPPGVAITNVTDTTNLNADLTSDYILSTMLLRDYGGTDRTYNMYTLTLSGPYSTSANHVITTN